MMFVLSENYLDKMCKVFINTTSYLTNWDYTGTDVWQILSQNVMQKNTTNSIC